MDDKALMERDYRLLQVEEQSRALQQVFPYLARARYVPGEGPDEVPKAFVVLNMPSAVDEVQQRPFRGQSGLIVRQLLRFAGLEPAECWLTNGLKYRLPRGREPKLPEVQAFRKPLQEEWYAVGAPRLMIAVGTTALSVISGEIVEASETQFFRRVGKIQLVTMRHPSVGFGDVNMQEQIESEWAFLKEWRNENGFS